MSETFRIDGTKVSAREVGGELMILNLDTRRYLAGNPAAAALWPLLERGATRDDFVDQLVARFDVDQEQARADVETFIESLEQLGMLDA
jgi:hypothetical protein